MGNGDLTATATVAVVEDDHTQVFVSVTYNAPGAKDTARNTFNMYGAVITIYSNLAGGGGYYDLPMNLRLRQREQSRAQLSPINRHLCQHQPKPATNHNTCRWAHRRL